MPSSGGHDEQGQAGGVIGNSVGLMSELNPMNVKPRWVMTGSRLWADPGPRPPQGPRRRICRRIWEPWVLCPAVGLGFLDLPTPPTTATTWTPTTRWRAIAEFGGHTWARKIVRVRYVCHSVSHPDELLVRGSPPGQGRSLARTVPDLFAYCGHESAADVNDEATILQCAHKLTGLDPNRMQAGPSAPKPPNRRNSPSNLGADCWEHLYRAVIFNAETPDRTCGRVASHPVLFFFTRCGPPGFVPSCLTSSLTSIASRLLLGKREPYDQIEGEFFRSERTMVTNADIEDPGVQLRSLLPKSPTGIKGFDEISN